VLIDDEGDEFEARTSWDNCDPIISIGHSSSTWCCKAGGEGISVHRAKWDKGAECPVPKRFRGPATCRV